MTGTDPVRWWCFDDWCDPLRERVPGPDSPLWEAHYANDCERGKRTTRRALPEVFSRLRAGADEWSARLGYSVSDDPTLHGGGLHVTAPGGYLGCHLDYDRHPVIPDRRRALNLIAFLHPEWQSSWGGQFYLADPMGKPAVRFDPLPGRLIAFEVGDLSYHGVAEVTGPAERVSAAVYFLSPATPAHTRRRALFLPRR